MTLSIVLQFVVVLAAIWMGARYSGVGLGLWGAVGLLVLVVGVRRQPDLAAGRRDADHPGGDHGRVGDGRRRAASTSWCAIAERIIRANPKYVTIVAPLTTWTLHVRRRHRAHRLSAAAGDLRDRAPERHPARAADGGGDDRLAAGDHRQPGRRGDRGDDRPVRREGADAVGAAARS